MSGPTKICSLCCEEINAAAKVCPQCCRPQGAKALLLLVGPIVVAVVLLIGFSRVMVNRVITPEKNSFLELREKITVETAEFSFSECCDGINVSTVGTIKNESGVSWENFKIEVRYLNKDGNLIDTISNSSYGLVSHPNEKTAFRVKGSAAQPESEYVSVEVIIKQARELSSWP